MKKLLIAIIILSQFSCKQKAETCDCPETDVVMDRTPFKIFKFTSGKSVAITSAPDSSGSKPVYREFGIYECGADSLIRFYAALEPCLLNFEDDTLFVSHQELLALGENFGWVDTTWLIDKYYYDNGALKTRQALPSYLGYNSAQINEVLRRFEATVWETQMTSHSDSTDDKMMQLANSMMIAAISGSDTARVYFKQFNEKFKPDGVLHEHYDQMEEMLKTAKTVTKRNNSN